MTDAPWFTAAQQRFVDVMPQHFDRLTWSAERLRAHQLDGLRLLLR